MRIGNAHDINKIVLQPVHLEQENKTLFLCGFARLIITENLGIEVALYTLSEFVYLKVV